MSDRRRDYVDPVQARRRQVIGQTLVLVVLLLVAAVFAFKALTMA